MKDFNIDAMIFEISQAEAAKVVGGFNLAHTDETAQSASGLPTGKRQHKPFVVTKPVDK